MASISCDICFEAFMELERVPKMLDCGHTFCSVCLDVLSSQICPTCKATLTKAPEEYPTNFIVLSLKKVETGKSYPVSQIAGSLLKMKELYLLRREMILKNIRKRTDLKNKIANNLIKIQQMLEMDPEVLDSTDEEMISELETNLVKIDEVLFCCGKMDIKTTYPLSKYINTACFLFDLVNRIHEEEEIYVYERVDGKPKYGRVSLNKDVINFHVLDLPKVDKLSSVVSLQDVRKCVTNNKFQTFIKIGNETLCFSITNSSFLAIMFIKLCTGETGRKIKGVSASFKWKQIAQIPNHVTKVGNHLVRHMQPNTAINQFEYIRIEKFMQNDVEVENLDDYDVSIVAANNETAFSEGDFVLQMLESGVCNIIKLSNTTGLICKNAVAKLMGSLPVGFNNIQMEEITDSGLSLMYSNM